MATVRLEADTASYRQWRDIARASLQPGRVMPLPQEELLYQRHLQPPLIFQRTDVRKRGSQCFP